MLTGHLIHFVEDYELPDGTDWMMLEVGDEVHCIVRRSCVTPSVLEGAWAGYRHLAAVS